VCQGLMGAEIITHLHKNNIRLTQDIDMVCFVDYDSSIYQLYENQMDSIVQPVEELALAAGEQILKRIEDPETRIFEEVLTSTYKPYDIPQQLWGHSSR